MADKHSPGPWTWRYFMETLVDAKGEEVMTFMPYAAKGWVCEADARLIAAAPELLAALKTRVGTCIECLGGSCSACPSDRTLIRRIEGPA